jgi:hypothetical protein
VLNARQVNAGVRCFSLGEAKSPEQDLIVPCKLSGMAKPLMTDELWEDIDPLLPPEHAKFNGGRPRIPIRDVLRRSIFLTKVWPIPKEAATSSMVESPLNGAIDNE